MRFRSICRDVGSVLIEAVGFVVLAFGIILTAGLGLFELQAAAIELQSIARNSVRSFVLDDSQSLPQLVQRNLSASERWRGREIDIRISCSPDCLAKPTQVRIELSAGQIKAEAFGVNGG